MILYSTGLDQAQYAPRTVASRLYTLSWHVIYRVIPSFKPNVTLEANIHYYGAQDVRLPSTTK